MHCIGELIEAIPTWSGGSSFDSSLCRARHDVLAPYLKAGHAAIASINSPMQCMMKEICAQCLQKHVDPVTGKEIGFVFSCFNQDQLLDKVDFPHLNARLRQNTVQEKLTKLWIDHCLASLGFRKRPPLDLEDSAVARLRSGVSKS